MQYLFTLRRNYVVIPKLGVAYGRVPKSANSTIKRQLAKAAGIDDRFDGKFSKDEFWRDKAPDAFLMTAVELRRAHPDIFVFSFVREPLARLVSCYRSKILRAPEVPLSFRREGLSKQTSFRDFALHAAGRPDWRCNVHYRAQAHILSHKGDLVPDFIGRFETLAEDWRRLQDIVEDRTGNRLPDPPIKKANPDRPLSKPGDGFEGDEALMARLRARFADDYRLFYPESLEQAS